MARTLDVECEVMDEQKETAEKMLISCLLQDLGLISETPLIEDDFSTPMNYLQGIGKLMNLLLSISLNFQKR